jgi:hypothetical protein
MAMRHVKDGVGRARRSAGSVVGGLHELAHLKERLDEMDLEIQECRNLNKRLAEIADVVAEVLLPAEQRDEERLRAVLSAYRKAI